MFEAMINGLRLVMDWQIIGLMLFATLLGNFFGAVPGLGGTLGLALLIPFVFGMEPFMGLAFLLAMHSVVHTGGSIPGILFGIPGTGPTVATIVDGYPMTKQGRGGEAMGAQLAASALGGIIGAGLLSLLIPVMRPIAMVFGSPEVFMLIVFGLTFIVVLSRESIAKGLVAALIGLLFGTIGLDPHTGVGRFTFDQLWLWDGLPINPIVLGVFAFAEIIELGARGGTAKIAESTTELKMRWSQLWDGTVAVFRNWWLALRTAVIGTLIGVIPGLGGDAASWICYGHAAQTCKNNQNFGKGDIRGVIGVETANNSKEGGSLLPTLVFGIPGSSGMAILLGAFIILGIVPGPKMITEHLNLVWGMVWVMVIANIFGALTLYPLCGYMGRLAFLRSSLIIPPIMVLAAIGAFLIRGFWQDVLLAVMFGFLGYGMKKWTYPRAPLLLGFIMGPLAEGYLHKSLGVYGLEFLIQPIVLVLLVMVISFLGYSTWSALSEKKKGKQGRIKVTEGGMVFSSAILVAFILCFWLTSGWSFKGRLFPQVIIIPGMVLSLWTVVQGFIRIRSPVKLEIESDSYKRQKELKRSNHPITLKNEIVMMSWIVGFLCLILILGFWVTIALFLPIFMHFFGHESKQIITAYTLGTWGIIYLVFAVSMKVPLYSGILGLAW
jgi:TctA family transporter